MDKIYNLPIRQKFESCVKAVRDIIAWVFSPKKSNKKITNNFHFNGEIILQFRPVLFFYSWTNDKHTSKCILIPTILKSTTSKFPLKKITWQIILCSRLQNIRKIYNDLAINIDNVSQQKRITAHYTTK